MTMLTLISTWTFLIFYCLAVYSEKGLNIVSSIEENYFTNFDEFGPDDGFRFAADRIWSSPMRTGTNVEIPCDHFIDIRFDLWLLVVAVAVDG